MRGIRLRSARRRLMHACRKYTEDLIRDGLIQPPLELRRTYGGVEVGARVEADGSVSVDGERVPTLLTLSKAADLARTRVLAAQGEEATVNTNGWTFWLFVDDEGKERAVDELRKRCRVGRGASGRG